MKKVINSNINPFRLFFGRWLRLERKRLDLDANKVAEALCLSSTYYRLVESGRAALNSGLLLRLIEVFANSATEKEIMPAIIHFHRIAIYLIASNCLTFEMSQMANSGETGRIDLLAMKKIAEYDADCELLYKGLMPYFSIESDTKKLDEFLEGVAVPSLVKFFATVNQQRPISKSFVFEFDGSSLSYVKTLATQD